MHRLSRYYVDVTVAAMPLPCVFGSNETHDVLGHVVLVRLLDESHKVVCPSSVASEPRNRLLLNIDMLFGMKLSEIASSSVALKARSGTLFFQVPVAVELHLRPKIQHFQTIVHHFLSVFGSSEINDGLLTLRFVLIPRLGFLGFRLHPHWRTPGASEHRQRRAGELCKSCGGGVPAVRIANSLLELETR